jgi:hypothetical protein
MTFGESFDRFEDGPWQVRMGHRASRLFVLIPRTITFNHQFTSTAATPLTTASHVGADSNSPKLLPTRHVELILSPLHLTSTATASPRRALGHAKVPRLNTHNGRPQQGARHRLSRMDPRRAPSVKRSRLARAGRFWLLSAQ